MTDHDAEVVFMRTLRPRRSRWHAFDTESAVPLCGWNYPWNELGQKDEFSTDVVSARRDGQVCTRCLTKLTNAADKVAKACQVLQGVAP